MNLNDIKALMQSFDESGIHKFALEMDTIKLKLEKEPVVQTVVTAAPVAHPPVLPQASVESPLTVVHAAEATPSFEGTPVKSPVVGTFYSASAPGAEPYVKVGQRVEKGQTLCIVEAMKMMNEITAPVSGTITEILVAEEDMVEFDQVIMLIKE